ncbi:MAG: 7TM diverse intracellular signaling domain-containing protein, partial [Bacteroidota bacterium]
MPYLPLFAQPIPTVIRENFDDYGLFEFDLSDSWHVIPNSEGIEAADIRGYYDSAIASDYPETRLWWVLSLYNLSDTKDFYLRFMNEPGQIELVTFIYGEEDTFTGQLGSMMFNPDTEVMPRLNAHQFLLDRRDTLVLFARYNPEIVGPPEANLSQGNLLWRYNDHFDRISVIFSAVFVMMLFYNLSIYSIVRDESYLYYCLLALGCLLHAFNFQFDRWFAPVVSNHLSIFSATVMSVGGAGYWMSILKGKIRFWHNFCKALAVVGLLVLTALGIGLALIPKEVGFFNPLEPFAALLAAVVILSWLISAVVLVVRKIKEANLYMLTNIPIIIGSIFFLIVWIGVSYRGLEPGSELVVITNYVFFGSVALQMLLFSIAIGRSLKRAQMEDLIKEKLQRDQLEREVADRTEELISINRELSLKNDELKKTNGTKNRLLAILSHDFRAPINNLASLMALLKEHQISQEDFSAMIPGLEKSISDTSNFMSLLVRWTQSQTDGLIPNKSTFSVSAIVKKA